MTFLPNPWADVEVAIATVLPERAAMLSELLVAISVQMPGASVRVEPQRRGYTHREMVPRVLGRATRPWLLQLEDDVILAEDFGERVGLVLSDLAVEHAPAPAVSLYSPQLRPDGYYYEARLHGTLCVLYTGDLARQIPELCARYWSRPGPRNHHNCDVSIGEAIRESGAPLIVVYPSAVQHRPGPSMLGGEEGRGSPTFRRIHMGRQGTKSAAKRKRRKAEAVAVGARKTTKAPHGVHDDDAAIARAFLDHLPIGWRDIERDRKRHAAIRETAAALGIDGDVGLYLAGEPSPYTLCSKRLRDEIARRVEAR